MFIICSYSSLAISHALRVKQLSPDALYTVIFMFMDMNVPARVSVVINERQVRNVETVRGLVLIVIGAVPEVVVIIANGFQSKIDDALSISIFFDRLVAILVH